MSGGVPTIALERSDWSVGSKITSRHLERLAVVYVRSRLRSSWCVTRNQRGCSMALWIGRPV